MHPYSLLLPFWVVLVSGTAAYAQIDDDERFYGFRAVATNSRIDGPASTLIRDIYPAQTYRVADEPMVGFSASAFVHTRFDGSRFAGQPETGYADLAGRFVYADLNDLEYTIDINYTFLRLVPAFKYYPTAGFNFTLGASIGLILNSERLTYLCNHPTGKGCVKILWLEGERCFRILLSHSTGSVSSDQGLTPVLAYAKTTPNRHFHPRVCRRALKRSFPKVLSCSSQTMMPQWQ